MYCMIFTCGVALNHISFPFGLCESANYVKYMKEFLPFQIDFQRDTYFGNLNRKKENGDTILSLKHVLSPKSMGIFK